MTKQSEPAPALITATVARGRSIEVPTGEMRLVGSGPDGKELMRAICRTFGPGETVELPADEVATFRKLGYLINPDNPNAVPVSEGPEYELGI